MVASNPETISPSQMQKLSPSGIYTEGDALKNIMEFDKTDAEYLSRHFTARRLQDEIQRAEVQVAVIKGFSEPDHPHPNDLFPWAEFANTCRQALELIKQRRPKPTPNTGLKAEDIKAKNDIVDVVSRYTKLRKSGKNFTGLCPFHQEKNPSFMVYPEQQRFKCYGCGKHGDVITITMIMERVDFQGALAKLNK